MIKTTLLIVCLLIQSIATFSQSTDALDDANGYKIFKFGDDISKYKEKLDMKSRKSFMKTYIYEGNEKGDLYLTFEYRFWTIELGFDLKNQLNHVVLSRVYDAISDKNHYEQALSAMRRVSSRYERVLGQPSKVIVPEKGVRQVTGNMWLGTKVKMRLTTEYYGVDVGTTIYLSFTKVVGGF